jgi:hypothetical protein
MPACLIQQKVGHPQILCACDSYFVIVAVADGYGANGDALD